MKKIIFLLLFTIASYGQAVFDEGIQITNTESTTAAKVNVQEANGKVNTQTIKTGFNKNIGLGGSDVVGATTLLNQYSTTPVDWTATAFNSGQVVFYGGKQWIAKIATVAGDVPAVSSKWEEITFEALANKTTTVDQTIIDGSTNAVAGNAVFDGLALKSNIGHTHVASQITDLSKASVGLGNVDNTSDLSKPLSTATINALATKAPISSVHNPVTLGTANGLSLATQQLSLGLASSGVTGALSGTDWNTFNNKQNALTNPITGTGVAGQISFWSGTGTQIGDSGLTWDGTNGLVSTKQIILDAQNIAFIIGNNTPTNFAQFYYNSVNKALQFTRSNGDNTIVVKDVTGNVGINQVLPTEKLDVVGNGKFSGTISASPATTANQVVVKSQLDAVAARPYKVYTALLSQTGTNAPTIIVLENTLGATISMTRQSTGHYRTTISTGNFPANRTFKFIQNGNYTITKQQILTAAVQVNTVAFDMYTEVDGVKADDVLMNAAYEIRIYP